MSDAPRPVVTVTATLMDGPVVRWFWNILSAEAHLTVISVSRNGVMAHNNAYLAGPEAIPAAWISQAEVIYRRMCVWPDSDLTAYATHKRYISGALEELPVTEMNA